MRISHMGRTLASGEQARVLDFWRAIEMLNPGKIPKLDRRHRERGKRLVFDVETDDKTPWSAGHPVTAEPLPPNLTWRFTVYAGVFELESVRRSLEGCFGVDDASDEKRVTGETALFAFTVDRNGFLVENSGTLSAC